MTTAASASTRTVSVADVGDVELTVEERGSGQPFLLLHGGAGPQSMTGFATLLAETKAVRTLNPVHPGFLGTPRPDGLTTPAHLAALYERLVETLELDDVTVVGGSIGGWIAAELALLSSPRISGVVLVGAIGIQVEGHPVADVSHLNLPQVMALSYHDPAPFLPDPRAFTEQQQAAMAANRAAYAVYDPAGGDPTLLDRLPGITIPTLVISGEADQIAVPEYGRAYARAIHFARYELLPRTGHMPMIETPQLLLDTIWDAGDTTTGTYQP